MKWPQVEIRHLMILVAGMGLVCWAIRIVLADHDGLIVASLGVGLAFLGPGIGLRLAARHPRWRYRDLSTGALFGGLFEFLLLSILGFASSLYRFARGSGLALSEAVDLAGSLFILEVFAAAILTMVVCLILRSLRIFVPGRHTRMDNPVPELWEDYL